MPALRSASPAPVSPQLAGYPGPAGISRLGTAPGGKPAAAVVARIPVASTGSSRLQAPASRLQAISPTPAPSSGYSQGNDNDPAQPFQGGGGDSSKLALRITGCTGKYKLINDTYEPMHMPHQDKTCWCARSAAPIYLFHTGKARWVISKRINDGARCYAFVSDDGGDPASCKGPWQCCDENGNWSTDPNIKCSVVPASKDIFVQLRVSCEDDIAKCGMADTEKLKQLWRRLDGNGNNVASLAEVDSLVKDMTKAGVWPAWLNNRDSIMRAYQKTTKLDGNSDDWVEKEEFHSLLLNLFWFGYLHNVFDDIDSNDDDKIDVQEFQQGLAKCGLTLSAKEAEAEFRTIDQDHGGMVLFVEFCAWVRKKVSPESNSAFDADIMSGEKAGDTVRKKHGDKATHSHFVSKKGLQDFDMMEQKIKDACKDNEALKKMWKKLDFNGNDVVSLAEIGKFVIEQYPLLNHQPALMRAYKATIANGPHDEWVHKPEFKALLINLFYFNKLFWLFDMVDENKDRRLGPAEFKWCMTVCGLKWTDAKYEAEFKKIDVNGGGIILFDEFCMYFTLKHCPEAMSEFIDHTEDSPTV